MYACNGVLAALYERERTGKGTDVEVAMLDALGEWTSQPYLYATYGGTPPPRTGARHASISPYGPYRAGDGAQVFIGVQNEREWAVLCAHVLGRPDLAEDVRFARNPLRVAHDAELRELLEQALSSGIPAPPAAGQLRMFAGGRVCLRTHLRFGEAATRTTRVVRATHKQGASGPLTFVTVRSEIEQQGHVAIVDEQDIVYRPQGRALVARPDSGTADRSPAPGLVLDVDPVLLFRFSALTYNAHRIHYDQAHAAAEGYPALVVHGPLQALLMGELIRRAGAALLGQEFAYRLVAPVFGAQRLTATADDASMTSVHVLDGASQVTATSTLRPWTPSGPPAR